MPLKDIKKHPRDYLILIAGVVLILIAFTLSSPNETSQRACAILLGSFYTLWGIWHHTQDNSLTKATLLEYLAMSMLVSAVLWLAVSY